jgi:hypothetical protein
MTFAEWLLFAATGRVLIYVWFQFPLPPKFALKKSYFYTTVNKLHSCDLCAGVWLYGLLAVVTGADMSGAGSIVTMLATGAVTSFLVHLFVLGWKSKFEVVVI